jgi:hypothetical protein
MHIGVDADTGQTVAAALTTNGVDDGSQVDPMLDRIDRSTAAFTGDGAYDQEDVHGEVAASLPMRWSACHRVQVRYRVRRPRPHPHTATGNYN